MAQNLAEKMEMFLRKDFSIVLIGHSLAGCVAMILAQILQAKKLKVFLLFSFFFIENVINFLLYFQVAEIITYGQPNIFPSAIPKKTQVLKVTSPLVRFLPFGCCCCLLFCHNSQLPKNI